MLTIADKPSNERLPGKSGCPPYCVVIKVPTIGTPCRIAVPAQVTNYKAVTKGSKVPRKGTGAGLEGADWNRNCM